MSSIGVTAQLTFVVARIGVTVSRALLGQTADDANVAQARRAEGLEFALPTGGYKHEYTTLVDLLIS